MTVRQVVVAVPARNEAAAVARCLRSIDVAAGRVAVPVTIVVAADSCGDGTVERARACRMGTAGLAVVSGAWRRVGAARAVAVAHGLCSVAAPARATWIVNTDADCEVAPDWLARHLALAHRHQAVAGVVGLDPAAPPPLERAFRRHYRLDGSRHRHVHGANLGVRADAYLAVGGWNPATAVGEDNELWASLLASGRPVVHTTRISVTTSARLAGRVDGGFATYLAELADGLPTGPVLAVAGG